MPYLIAVAIPLILIASGALAKKLVRGSPWIRSDFFLGVELALTAMGSSLVYIFELAQNSDERAIHNSILAAGFFTIVCFFLLFWIMAVHQDWDRRHLNPLGQLMWLGGFCNLMGIALLAGFVLFVKGVH
jgi:heme/copper-type cytochrome/quinol oxidase subunit 4